jgi:aminoglycoside phosphotransferase (APT) family kinase protein
MFEFEGPLRDFIRECTGDAGADVKVVRRLSGGASRETFELAVGGGAEADDPRCVLQRLRPGGTVGSKSMETEAHLVRDAHGRGVPSPEVLWASDDPAHIGAPFMVSRWVDGETIARRILRDDEFAVARRNVVAQSARALARIHEVPVGAVPELTRTGDPLDELREMFDALGEPHPAFELGFRWLEANRPAGGHDERVVHGDFRLGNLMVDADGLAAVLDWELAHVGDPMEDLGWFCVKAWRFGAEPPVAGLGQYDEFFAAYEDASGQPVDRDVAHWWELLGTLKWGVICILQASTHISGMSRSVELAAIGRRVCENEYDLLELLP